MPDEYTIDTHDFGDILAEKGASHKRILDNLISQLRYGHPEHIHKPELMGTKKNSLKPTIIKTNDKLNKHHGYGVQPEPEEQAERDFINHPDHYNTGDIEVIDAIEDWDLSFNAGNAIKYVARHCHKGNPIQDLEKAVWYLERELERLKPEPIPAGKYEVTGDGGVNLTVKERA